MTRAAAEEEKQSLLGKENTKISEMLRVRPANPPELPRLEGTPHDMRLDVKARDLTTCKDV